MFVALVPVCWRVHAHWEPYHRCTCEGLEIKWFPARRRRPIARRRRRKFGGQSAVLLNFEWFLSGWAMGRQVEYRGKLTPVLGITDALPYSTFTGLLPGVREV